MLPIFLEDPSRFSVVLSRRCLAPMDPCSLIGFFWASWSQLSLNGSMEMLKRFWLQLIVVPRFVTTSRDSLMCSSFSKDSLGFFGIGWDSFRIGGRLKWIGFFQKKDSFHNLPAVKEFYEHLCLLQDRLRFLKDSLLMVGCLLQVLGLAGSCQEDSSRIGVGFFEGPQYLWRDSWEICMRAAELKYPVSIRWAYRHEASIRN